LLLSKAKLTCKKIVKDEIEYSLKIIYVSTYAHKTHGEFS